MRSFVVALALMPALAWAEDAPRVTVELAEDSAVVGQPLVVRIKVLVPSFMPKPPVFPTLEVPGLMVRLPERAGGPVSEKIDGETWSGVQRAYRLYPLQAGAFQIPAQDLTLTLAGADPANPQVVQVPFEAFSFTATVPDGAEGLDPLILAAGFTLSQQVEGAEGLEVGGAVTRTLTAKITGTTPVLIPGLTPAAEDPALRAYPDEPDVAESEDRGLLSGTRTERVTYVAQAPGDVVLPALELSWFNTGTGKVETASVPEQALTITGAPLAAVGSGQGDMGRVLWALAGLVVLGLIAWRLRPCATAVLTGWRARWQASEAFAWRQLKAAIGARDLGAVYVAYDLWLRRAGLSQDAKVSDALARIGRERFAGQGTPDAASWAALQQAVSDQRRHGAGRAAAEVLPPLNPR